MSIDVSTFSEKISLALNSKDINILQKLKNDISAVIRKSVATNMHATKEILYDLAYDPVLNVSYTAFLHPNCNVSRDFAQHNHPCVKCKSDFIESENCVNCIKLITYQTKLVS